MPFSLQWSDVALRLFCTVVAGTVIGLDRDKKGRPAGLRTTLLVCLAASLSMLEANALLSTRGKPQDSFTQMDVMRLPLGILTGMGFIGAGAIVRKGSLVIGLTTAATMWFVTVMGFCFGGGQIALGFAALGVAFAVLSGMKWIETRIKRDQSGSLRLIIAADGPTEEQIRSTVSVEGFKIQAVRLTIDKEERRRELGLQLTWHARDSETGLPEFVEQLRQRVGVLRVEWEPHSLEAAQGGSE